MQTAKRLRIPAWSAQVGDVFVEGRLSGLQIVEVIEHSTHVPMVRIATGPHPTEEPYWQKHKTIGRVFDPLTPIVVERVVDET
jgi:hypothetical protein